MNKEIVDLRNLITQSQIRIREIQDKECQHVNCRVDKTEDWYCNRDSCLHECHYGIDVFCHDCGKDMWFDEEDEEYLHYKSKITEEDESGDKKGD